MCSVGITLNILFVRGMIMSVVTFLVFLNWELAMKIVIVKKLSREGAGTSLSSLQSLPVALIHIS